MSTMECERAALWNCCARWDVGVNVWSEKNILIRLKNMCMMRVFSTNKRENTRKLGMLFFLLLTSEKIFKVS
jgi:hypothetical protein